MSNQPILGYLSLSLVVLIWVGSGYLIQWIFSSADATNGYKDNPIAMTVISMGLFSLLLLLPGEKSSKLSALLLKKGARKKFSFPLIDSHSLVLGSVWLFAQLTYNVSLKHIAVSTSSSISALSSFFTYAFSLALLKGYTIDKYVLCGIGFSITGIHLLVSDSGQNAPLSIIGLFLAIFSCSLYGLFSVLLKKWTKHTDSVTSLFGRLGTVAIIIGIPLVFVAHIFGIEIFRFPSIFCFLAICGNAIFGSVFSDVLLAKSIMLLTPIIVSVGLTFTIPVSMLIEGRADLLATPKKFSGYILVVLSLVLVGSYKPGNR